MYIYIPEAIHNYLNYLLMITCLHYDFFIYNTTFQLAFCH